MDVSTLFLIFLKVSFITFGGSAPLPLLQDELVRERGVLRDEDFAAAIAIGLITPGPNGLFTLPIGYFVAGVPGALAAALALCIIAILVLVLLRLHRYVAHLTVVKAFTRGILAGTIGLLLTLGYILARGTVRGPLDFAIAVAAFLLVAFTRVDTLLVVAGAGGIGLAKYLLGL